MSTATISPIHLPADVAEFLRRHQAEAAFEQVCQLVRDCYPGRLDMTFRLLDDPDTEDRQWLVLDVIFPASISLEVLRQQDDVYHQRLVTELPLETCPLFTVSARFTAR